MDTGLDSVAFSNSSEYVEFIEDDSYGSPYSSNLIEERTKRNNVLRRVLFGGLVLLVICVVILFGWIWLKPSLPNVVTNSTLCSKPSSNLQNLKSNYRQMEFRRQFVREMMLDSWKAYELYVVLIPVSRNALIEKPGQGSGLSIVASMSTLWTMDLQEEFERGKYWIERKLDLSKLDRNVKIFDVVTHYVGGLLSCYALTNDSMFLNKAKEIAQLVEPAFNTTTGIPYENINLNSSEAEGNYQFLSYMSGFHVDFNYLSDAANETKYRNMINRIQQNLKKIKKPKNLFYAFINIRNYWSTEISTLSGMGREFYASLVKSYIQSNHLNVQSIEMYKEAMDAVEAVKMFEVWPNGLYYARDYYQQFSKYAEYETCYLGAMLSMGANALQQALTMNSSIGGEQKSKELYRIHRHWELAEKLTETCHVASSQTKTGLGPEAFYFDHTNETIILDHGYNLSPEFAESNFVLWRLTRDPKYRDHAWEMAQAIKHFCTAEGGKGYSAIYNVDEIPTEKDEHHHQPAHFLSATLKYLYLTFTDDDVLPLDQWVFNAQGNPLPICGKNPVYPSYMCAHYL